MTEYFRQIIYFTWSLPLLIEYVISLNRLYLTILEKYSFIFEGMSAQKLADYEKS